MYLSLYNTRFLVVWFYLQTLTLFYNLILPQPYYLNSNDDDDDDDDTLLAQTFPY